LVYFDKVIDVGERDNQSGPKLRKEGARSGAHIIETDLGVASNVSRSVTTGQPKLDSRGRETGRVKVKTADSHFGDPYIGTFIDSYRVIAYPGTARGSRYGYRDVPT
jgi:hypothetical protein